MEGQKKPIYPASSGKHRLWLYIHRVRISGASNSEKMNDCGGASVHESDGRPPKSDIRSTTGRHARVSPILGSQTRTRANRAGKKYTETIFSRFRRHATIILRKKCREIVEVAPRRTWTNTKREIKFQSTGKYPPWTLSEHHDAVGATNRYMMRI